MRYSAFALAALVLAASLAAAQDSRTYNGFCNANRKPSRVRNLKATSLTTTSTTISWREPAGHECVRCAEVLLFSRSADGVEAEARGAQSPGGGGRDARCAMAIAAGGRAFAAARPPRAQSDSTQAFVCLTSPLAPAHWARGSRPMLISRAASVTREPLPPPPPPPRPPPTSLTPQKQHP